MAAISAAQRVFAITELLEAIISEIPPEEILIYQRVGPKWRDVIMENKKFQRALFLAPPKEVGEVLTSTGKTLNNAKVLTLRDFEDDEENNRQCWSFRDDGGKKTPQVIYGNAMLKPLLLALMKNKPGFRNSKSRSTASNSDSDTNQQIAISGQDSQRSRPYDILDRLPPSWRYPEASWQRMFFTQPPSVTRLGTHMPTVLRKRGKYSTTAKEAIDRVNRLSDYKLQQMGEIHLKGQGEWQRLQNCKQIQQLPQEDEWWRLRGMSIAEAARRRSQPAIRLE